MRQRTSAIVPPWGAAIAQWIRLRLPSCRLGFESPAPNLYFSIYTVQIVCLSLALEYEQKDTGIGPFLK